MHGIIDKNLTDVLKSAAKRRNNLLLLDFHTALWYAFGIF